MYIFILLFAGEFGSLRHSLEVSKGCCFCYTPLSVNGERIDEDRFMKLWYLFILFLYHDPLFITCSYVKTCCSQHQNQNIVKCLERLSLDTQQNSKPSTNTFYVSYSHVYYSVSEKITSSTVVLFEEILC